MTLPAGIITFLFTDIEGSALLWEEDAAGMRLALRQHNEILDQAITDHHGYHFKTVGDEYQAAFSDPPNALAAALAAQRHLIAADWVGAGPLRVRMGLHLGHAQVAGADYATSHTLNRVARIMDAAHGGQILLSGELAGLLRAELPAQVSLLDLGQHQLKGLRQTEYLCQILAPDLMKAFPVPRTLASPSRLGGRYERQTVLGQGAMGTVYRGLDIISGAPVAIKALRPEVLATTPELLARFQNEGEALRRLNHPNIVTMLDMLAVNDQHYLVMEYVSGGDLRRRLTDEPQLPLDQVLNIALDLADALTRAHRLGIIHRDLKPTNVLLAADGTPRLSDFGIAKFGNQSGVTRSGLVLGTLAYLSPEACQGLAPDERTDIWSFGVLLYEMLAGRRPFVGDSIASLLVNVLNQPLPDITAFRSDVPEALQDLLFRMLTKERLERIPSVRLVGAALEAVLGSPTTAPVAGETLSTMFVDRFSTPVPEDAGIRHNLPPQPTAFIGREEELAALTARLAQPDVRLLTILGPGGMGKTRLALATAAALAPADATPLFPDGVFFVDLVALTDPQAVVTTIAEAIDLHFAGEQLPQAQLLLFLERRSLLLVMDNFERLLNEDDNSRVVTEIIGAAPSVKIIVTSRARLNQQNEHIFQLGGLDFPEWETPADALRYGAVQLFLQSARRVRPDFELVTANLNYVARICRLAQGMPLGIVLAAAWLEMLTPAEIAQEMEQSLDFLASELAGLPERQQSVRVVFAYAWGRLSRAERAALARLSVFRGGFDRPAAQAVTGASLPTLLALVNKSLLSRNAASGRFQIHELLRQYAAERLAEDENLEFENHDRHSVYYCADLAQKEPLWQGAQTVPIMAAIETDFENVRRAWRWAAAQGEAERLVAPLESLVEFLSWYNWPHLAVDLLDAAARQLASFRADRAANTAARTLAEVRISLWQSSFHNRMDQVALSERLLAHSERLLDRPEVADLDTRYERALWQMSAGFIALTKGDFSEQYNAFRRSRQLWQALAQPWRTAAMTTGVGWAAYYQGRSGEAESLWRESLDLFHDLNHTALAVYALSGLAAVATEAGDLAAAEHLHYETLAIARKSRSPDILTMTCNNLGITLTMQGKFDEAQAITGEGILAIDCFGSIRNSLRLNLTEIHLHQGEYDGASELAQTVSAEGADATSVVWAQDLAGLAAYARNDRAAARRFWQESQLRLPELTRPTVVGESLSKRAFGIPETAQQSYRKAFKLALDLPSIQVALWAIATIPLYLATSGKIEQAVTLYALAATYPFVSKSQWFADVVGQEIEAVAAALPPAVAVRARARGTALDLWATVAALVKELEGSGPA